MNYAIQYHDFSNEWLIFDVGDGFELVGIHGTEADARRHVAQLQQSSEKKSRWSREMMPQAA